MCLLWHIQPDNLQKSVTGQIDDLRFIVRICEKLVLISDKNCLKDTSIKGAALINLPLF